MTDDCHIGFNYLQELHEQQQQQIDQALVRSMQTADLSGMKGEDLPYLLRSDHVISCILLVCFILFTLALRNGKKVLYQHMKNFFHHKKRSSLFDDVPNSDSRYVLALVTVTCILSGFCLYDYFSDENKMLFQLIPHSILLSVYIGAFALLILYKWGAYNFVNWIFFDKEKQKLWMIAFFDILVGAGFLLFPLVLLPLFFDLPANTAMILLFIILGFTKIMLFYKCIRNFFPHIHGSFHLILYFCALEIVPDLFLWKGIGFINNVLILKF